MDRTVDAVVIGAGHNGLVSAIRLAQKGWKVLVVEAAAVAGGSAKTAELTLPGYRHDLYATNVGLFLVSQFYQQNQSALRAAGFEPAVAKSSYSSVFPDGTGVGVTTDMERTRESVRRLSAADADAWDELVAYFDKTAPYFLPFMQMPLPSWRAARQAWRLFRGLGRRGTFELLQTLLQTPRDFVDQRFESEKMRALMVPWGMHLDFGPDVANGALFPFIQSVLNARNGIPLAVGGVGKLTQALVSLLEAAGGELRTGCAVEKVLTHSGRAVGVRLANGEEIAARRAVIGNVTPTQLVDKLLDAADVPEGFRNAGKRFRYGPGTMMIHLALDEPLQWCAGEAFSHFAYVHIGPYLRDMSMTYAQALNDILPDEPLLVVGQPTAIDPTRAPPGKHVLWVQVRVLPARPCQDSLDEIAPDSWDVIKEAYADRVIRKIARYAPNIDSAIRGRCVLSPLDLERDNANLVGGDSASGSHHLDQNYLFRPVNGWSRYRTPVAGLYLVGASTWPGGGLNATSGYLLAEQLR